MTQDPVPALRGRPKDAAKRRDIFDAARFLFLQRGFHGTSMEALAKQAGVSKATLYSHFEDKDALYRALIDDKMAAYHLDDFAPHLSGVLGDDLLYIAEHLLDLVYSPDGLDMMRMVIAEQREGSDLPRLFIDAGPRQVLGQIEAYLQTQNCHAAVSGADARAAAELFSSLVIGHTPMIFTLTGVAAPLDEAARQARARNAVQQFLLIQQSAADQSSSRS